MTGGTKPHLGEVVAFARAEHDRADDLLGAVVPARLREEPEAREASVLDNVVPFVRPRSNDNARVSEFASAATVRPAPVTGSRFTIARRAGFIALSLLVHGGVFAGLAYWYIPAPLNGTELEAISVELVPPGSHTPAGQSQTPAQNEGVAQSGQVTETPDEKPPVQQAEEPTTEQPQDVKVAEQETAPERPVAAEQPEPVLAPQEPAPAPAAKEPEPRESIAMVESPQPPELATEAPRETPPPPEPEKLTLLPQTPPEEKPVEPPKPELQKPEPQKPVEQKAEPKKPEAKKPEAKPKPKAKEATRIAARTAERTVERPAGPQRIDASNGTGIGRTTAGDRYSGIVHAHLQRFKRPGARDRGTVNVRFYLDAAGRPNRVQLVKSSGIAALDEEAQAMVRRASPFPPPPSGWTNHFTAPIGFSGD